MGCLSFIGDIFDSIINFFEEAWEDVWDAIKDLANFVWDTIGYPLVKFVFGILGFEDQTIDIVNVSATKLIPGEIADSMAQGTLRAILGNYSIVDELLRVSQVGPVNTSYHYLEYARNEYVHGLPTVAYDFNRFNQLQVRGIIRYELGGVDIIIDSANLNYPNFLDWCLYSTYQHALANVRPYTGIYPESDGGHPSQDIQFRRRQDYRKDQNGYREVRLEWQEPAYRVYAWDLSPNVPPGGHWFYDPATHEYWVGIYRGTSNVFSWLVFPGPEEAQYYIVRYYVAATAIYGEDAHQYVWLYKKGTGTWPQLEYYGSGESDYYNEVLPIVPLRRDFKGTNDPTSPSYDAQEESTARILLDKANLDYDELITAIDSNPDQAQITDAFLMFATNLYTTDQGELTVLYELFKNFAADSQVTKADFQADPSKVTTNVIRVSEQYYNSVLQFNYMESTYITTSNPVDEVSFNATVVPNGDGVNSYFTISKQINETQSIQILVHGPVVYQNVKTVADTFKVSTIQLSNDPAEQAKFNMPLTLDSLEGLSYYEKERVLFRALTIVAYAADQVHLDFYETPKFASAFSFVIQIVSIILLILSFGAATTAVAALIQFAKQLLVNYALSLLIYKVIEKYGADGFLAIVVAAAYYYYGGPGFKGVPTAEAILETVTLTLDSHLVLTNQEMEDLRAEVEDFLETKAEREEELQKAWDLLDNDADVDFYDLAMILDTHPEEHPSDFYTRTIHTGNPGTGILDYIGSYHDNLLTLPDPITSSLYE